MLISHVAHISQSCKAQKIGLQASALYFGILFRADFFHNIGPILYISTKSKN